MVWKRKSESIKAVKEAETEEKGGERGRYCGIGTRISREPQLLRLHVHVRVHVCECTLL